MATTQSFKTKTIMKDKKNPASSGAWGIAMDIGYSGVKIYSPTQVAVFPSYAKKVPLGHSDNVIGTLSSSDIAYRCGEDEYLVGASAVSALRTGDSDSATGSLYSRDRYFTPEYLVLARVALALGMKKNAYGDPQGKKVAVMSGLPPEYLERDKGDLTEVLSGEHAFSVKIGNGEWVKYDIRLKEEDIHVMSQPMGTLISIASDANGGALPKAAEYFQRNVLIMDIGFGTLDCFDLREHHIKDNSTWSNLGMRRIFEETAGVLEKDYGVSIPVYSFQDALEKSYVAKYDRKERKSVRLEFADILKKCSQKVCAEALEAIDGRYSGLLYHDYLVVTGGTGAAWFSQIKDAYKEMETLTVIDGGASDPTDPVFANVRGYYMHLTSLLKRR